MSRVIVIGASCVDVLAEGVTPHIFESGHEHVSAIRMDYGGDALNEAVVLASHGIPVSLLTRFAEDEAGRGMMRFLNERNVDISQSIVDPDGNTYMTVILVTKDGERNLIGTKSGTLRELSLKDLPKTLDPEAEIVSFASLFISHHFLKEDYRTLFERIKKSGKTLVCDTTTPKNGESARDYEEVFSLIDYFVPNAKEAMMLTGKGSVEEAAEELFACGVKHVIIKCGEKGCYLYDEAHREYIAPKHEVTPLDSTGAGDSFTAGLITGLLDQRNLIEALDIANAFGARAVTALGANRWSYMG